MKTTPRSFVANSSLVAALAMLVLIGGAARADVIKPVAATGNPQGYPGRLDARTVDGSGLSSTTMPTDPEAGSWPTHTTTADSNMWLAYPKSTYPNPTISFDLGAAYILSGAHVWNYNEVNLSNRGCRNVDVYVSNDNATWGSAVATWELGQASGNSSYAGENKSFPSPTQPVRYVKFVPTSDWGGDSRGLSEVRFISPPPVLAVVLTGPTNNQALSTSTSVTASATVASYGTPPYTVRFFLKQGEGAFGQAGGDVTANPYLADLGPLAAATYQIYATVTDSATPTANNATSATHTFTVGDLPPTVAITSPAANSSFPPGTAIVIDATASDDYSVTQVDFYADGSLIGTDSSAPYGCSWSGAAVGVHSLTAVATDNNSQTTTSAAVSVRVVVAPLTINLAPSGTASDNLQTHNRYNDLTNTVGNDPRLWFGIKWTSEQLVSALYLQAKLDDYPTDFVFQVANPGVTNPNLSADTDWTTPDGWTFAGNTNNHPSVTSATPLATYAVRVKATSADQFSSSELLVLKGVSTNVAPAATRGGQSGWAGTASRIADGVFMNDQQVTIQQVAPPPLTFDWATPQTLGGIMVAGGAGSYPTSYDVEYQDGSGNWQTAVNVGGNTKQISVAGFTPTTSQHFRVKLTGTSDNTYQRLSEIMLFTSVIPPTTTTLARTSGSEPSNIGNPLSFTATVSGASPTGNVTFYDGTTLLGSQPLDGSGVASIVVDWLAVGSHSITAHYPGDTNNLASTSAVLGQTVVEPRASSPYDTWADSFLPGADVSDPTLDFDSDTLSNLREFAFGTDPTVNSTGPMVYVAGGDVTTPGQPVLLEEGGTYYAVFGRRKDHVAAGLTYTVQFSADLSSPWVASVDVPTLVTGDPSAGDIEAVRVPFPGLITTDSGPQKVTFFRVELELAP